MRVHCIWSPVKHLWCHGMIFWTLLCSRNLLVTRLLSEVMHLIQQASSLRHSEFCTLYHPFDSWFLLWERWGQQQEPWEPFCPGEVLCLGPEVTVKGFLFLSSEEQQSAMLLIFLPFHFRELLSSIPTSTTLVLFPLVNKYHFFYIFTRKQLRGN